MIPDPLANIALIALLWLLWEIGWRLKRRWFEEETLSTQLYCPYREGRVPIADDYRKNVVWQDGSCYGYHCEECGRVHTWDFGIAPAPVHTGDKIRFRITAEGLVATKPNPS